MEEFVVISIFFVRSVLIWFRPILWYFARFDIRHISPWVVPSQHSSANTVCPWLIYLVKFMKFLMLQRKGTNWMCMFHHSSYITFIGVNCRQNSLPVYMLKSLWTRRQLSVIQWLKYPVFICLNLLLIFSVNISLFCLMWNWCIILFIVEFQCYNVFYFHHSIRYYNNVFWFFRNICFSLFCCFPSISESIFGE